MSHATDQVKAYLSAIGRKGGQISRRHLSSGQARAMVRVREARKAFRVFHTQWFWYMRPDMKITLEDVPAIVRGLRVFCRAMVAAGNERLKEEP